jgi:hypothetical protein
MGDGQYSVFGGPANCFRYTANCESRDKTGLLLVRLGTTCLRTVQPVSRQEAYYVCYRLTKAILIVNFTWMDARVTQLSSMIRAVGLRYL